MQTCRSARRNSSPFNNTHMTTYTLIHKTSLKIPDVYYYFCFFLNCFTCNCDLQNHHLCETEMDRMTRNVNFKGEIETGWLSKEVESEVKTLLACIARFQGYRYQSLSETGYKVGL